MYIEEPLLLEQSTPGCCGVDFPPVANTALKTGLEERVRIGLPEVSEPQVMRHFVRLSQQNFAIDTNFYPLGSCTMKHNPRLNEKVARLPGFAGLHPLQPESTVQGALKLMHDLQHWLIELTGMPAVTLAPAAGAHGELTGVMVIKAAHKAKGNPRKIILVPDSAHGTNPATAAMCGYTTVSVPSQKGLVDLAALDDAIEKHGEDIAAFMLTNPNTCGLFEPDILKIAEKIHAIGAYFYCDGANFNAIVGKVKPGDLGVDVMQLNLHKTFSTPHGGGGPGSGPVAVSEALVSFLPAPYVTKDGDCYTLSTPENTVGRIKAFHGHFGMFTRAMAYMKSHGADGMKQASEDAVLNANYLLSQLKSDFRAPYNEDDTPCMHECLLNDKNQKEQGISTLDIAKGLIEQGIHPMTIYFPLITTGAMLVEPTESESKQTLDHFIDVMREINARTKSDPDSLHAAPQNTPRKRLDEVKAAKQPTLTFCCS